MKKKEVGNVYALKLADYEYVYMRLVRSGYVQIFVKRYQDSNGDLANLGKERGIVNVHDNVYKQLEYIGSTPQDLAEKVELPTTYVYQPGPERYLKYYDGKMSISTKEECDGLEPTVVFDSVEQLRPYIQDKDRYLKSYHRKDFEQSSEQIQKNRVFFEEMKKKYLNKSEE